MKLRAIFTLCWVAVLLAFSLAHELTENHNSPQADQDGYMQPIYKVDPRFELSEPTYDPKLIT